MLLKIKVIPNSKKEEIIEGYPLIVIVRVKAKAENNKANAEVIKILSRHFKSRIRIIRGLKSKNKLIEF